MNTFWSSDLHLGHANILAYAGRPWIEKGALLEPYVSGKPQWASREAAQRCAARMNQRLIAEINMRCRETDTLIHLGDFCCRGNERGAAGVKTKAEEWQAMIKPKIIHVMGNHDRNNSVKGCIYGMLAKVGPLWVWACHHPKYCNDMIPPYIDAIVCGHVHEKWEVKRHEELGIPMINVGVDVRNFRPVKQTELIHLIQTARKETKSL